MALQSEGYKSHLLEQCRIAPENRANLSWTVNHFQKLKLFKRRKLWQLIIYRMLRYIIAMIAGRRVKRSKFLLIVSRKVWCDPRNNEIMQKNINFQCNPLNFISNFEKISHFLWPTKISLFAKYFRFLGFQGFKFFSGFLKF